MSDGTDSQCPICLEDYKNPKILLCSHKFCKQPCLQNLLNRAHGRTFRCPLCRQEFPVSFTRSILFGNDTNFHSSSPQNDEIPILSDLTYRYLRNLTRDFQEITIQSGEIQSTAVNINQEVIQTIPSEGHTTAAQESRCGADCTRSRYEFAIIVLCAAVCLVRIGLVFNLSLEGSPPHIFSQFVPSIAEVIIAYATFKRRYFTAICLIFLSFTASTTGFLYYTLQCDYNAGRHCVGIEYALKFFCTFDWILLIYDTVYIVIKGKCCVSCCRCNEINE